MKESVKTMGMNMNKRELYGLVYSFCMGDGSLCRQKYKGNYSGNAYFRADNINKNMDYILWRASVLENITAVTVKDVSKYGKEHCQPITNTRTRTHPIYTKLWNRIYSTGRKSLDPHQLKFMSWQFLAVLFQEDGTCYVSKKWNGTPQIAIATCNYSYNENVGLKFAIKEKLGVEFNVRRTTIKDRIYWRLVLPARYYDKFRNGVEPFIFDSFRYKIPENTNTRTIQV